MGFDVAARLPRCQLGACDKLATRSSSRRTPGYSHKSRALCAGGRLAYCLLKSAA